MRQGLPECGKIVVDRCRRNDRTGCLVWQGGVQSKGYGTIRCNGKYEKTHRIAYLAAFGEIPDGMHVLHKCDNRRCCEPSHLFLGTNADNIEDKMRKGRGGKKLSYIDACEVLRLLSEGRRQSEIAGRFGVNQSLVSRIKQKRYWPYASAKGA